MAVLYCVENCSNEISSLTGVDNAHNASTLVAAELEPYNSVKTCNKPSLVMVSLPWECFKKIGLTSNDSDGVSACCCGWTLACKTGVRGGMVFCGVGVGAVVVLSLFAENCCCLEGGYWGGKLSMRQPVVLMQSTSWLGVVVECVGVLAI